jgi:hypothetical protein
MDVDSTGAALAAWVESGVVELSAVDEMLIDLICDDPDLLAAEFHAILAAACPIPPVDSRRHAAACGLPGRGPAGVYDAGRGPASRPHHPGIGGWARQRSPPRFGVPTTSV